MQKCNSKLKIIFFAVVFNFSFLLFNLSVANAQVMKSENFVLQGGNFNMTSGNKESQNFKLSDVVGQVAAGIFTSKGFIINAGFLNGAAGTFLNFSVSPTLADFGQLTAETPVTRDLTIKIANGNYPGYIVKASQNQPLKTFVEAEIPDTACDSSDNPCTKAQGTLWQSPTSYGFGYRMSGRTVPTDFLHANYFRPFPATRKNEQPVIVMQSQAKKVTDEGKMHLNLNVSKDQPVGQYRNVISFTAIAGI